MPYREKKENEANIKYAAGMAAIESLRDFMFHGESRSKELHLNSADGDWRYRVVTTVTRHHT